MRTAAASFTGAKTRLAVPGEKPVNLLNSGIVRPVHRLIGAMMNSAISSRDTIQIAMIMPAARPSRAGPRRRTWIIQAKLSSGSLPHWNALADCNSANPWMTQRSARMAWSVCSGATPYPESTAPMDLMNATC